MFLAALLQYINQAVLRQTARKPAAFQPFTPQPWDIYARHRRAFPLIKIPTRRHENGWDA
jgi:hypothetical protein